MAKRRVVLTGAAGYVAQRMFKALDERWDVVPIDIRATTRDGTPVPGLVVSDLTQPDRNAYREHFRGADAVIHCGFVRAPGMTADTWQDNSDAKFQAEHANVALAYNVYRTALEEGVRRVVVCSSNHASDYYERLVWDGRVDMVTPEMPPRSDNWYGWAKAAYELLGFVFATGKVDGRKLEIVQWRIGGPRDDDIDKVEPGDIIAKIPRETTKTKDITGGLPRVVELFEARRPAETAVMSEIDGTVTLGAISKGKRKLIITGDDGEEREYDIPRGTHINVQDGDRVRAGEALMDGPLNPHDILRVLGMSRLQEYLVNEIQEVYRLQGVNINDKHIEVIVRQMLRWVKIKEVGDTEFLLEEQVDRFRFQDENERVRQEDGEVAQAEPLLLGITKASLSTDSFISAASFQETTRVLTEAAVNGKADTLDGLKENVIVGRLIPAGTGAVMNSLREIAVKRDALILEEREREAAQRAAAVPEQLPAAE